MSNFFYEFIEKANGNKALLELSGFALAIFGIFLNLPEAFDSIGISIHQIKFLLLLIIFFLFALLFKRGFLVYLKIITQEILNRERKVLEWSITVLFSVIIFFVGALVLDLVVYFISLYIKETLFFLLPVGIYYYVLYLIKKNVGLEKEFTNWGFFWMLIPVIYYILFLYLAYLSNLPVFESLNHVILKSYINKNMNIDITTVLVSVTVSSLISVSISNIIINKKIKKINNIRGGLKLENIKTFDNGGDGISINKNQ